MADQNGTVSLEVGTQLLHNETLWTVVELTAGQVILKQEGAVLTARVLIRHLCDPSSGYRFLETQEGATSEQTAPAKPFEPLARALTPRQLERALTRARDVREVLTGYQSGNKDDPAAGESREQYAPWRGLMQKYRAKAAELHVSEPTIRLWTRRYLADGERGLVDGRSRTTSSLFHACNPVWLEVATAFVADRTLKADISAKNLILLIRAAVERQYGPNVRLPGRTSAYIALKELDAGRSSFKDAPRRRSIASVPAAAFGHFHATRPGEVILIDTSRLDVAIYDSVIKKSTVPQVTAAMDLYDELIVGLRVTVLSTRSIDVASVLFEIVHPREAAVGLPEDATWPSPGVPETALYAVAAESDARYTGPGIVPDALKIDHGSIYVSDHLKLACNDLGISLLPARKYTGTDKSPLERWFGTLKTVCAQLLPGYTGKDPSGAGREDHGTAYLLADDVEKAIREWISLDYHRTRSSAEADDETPGIHLSPMERYHQGIAASGLVRLPRDPSLVYHLLKEKRRAITREGVSIGGLIYRAPILAKYRGRHSPDHNVGRRWSFRFNPDDLRQIYFQDPEDQKWHVIPWERASSVKRPFNEDALKIAKGYASEKGIDVDQVVLDLFRKWDAGAGLPLKEFKAARRQQAQDVQFRAALIQGAVPEPSESDADVERDQAEVPFVLEGLGVREAVDVEDYYSEAAEFE